MNADTVNDLGACEICEEAPATTHGFWVADVRLCAACASTEPCPYSIENDGGGSMECAMARERMVAGVGDAVPACPEHGPYRAGDEEAG